MKNNRIVLGIDELDYILKPGLMKNAILLIAGHPGVGKTTFAAQIIYNSIVKHGKKAVYLSFAETREDFYRYMETIGFNFERLEEEGKFKFISLLTVSDINLIDKTVEALMEIFDTFKPDRICLLYTSPSPRDRG